MHAKLLNRARPLWEFYVFEGLKDGEIGLYSKVHHACIDGGAGAALTEIVYDVSPTPREIAKAARRKRRKNDVRARWRRPSSSPTSSSGAADRSRARLIKPIDLPRTGKSDLGSILFDNAMGQIEQTMRVLSGLPSIAKTIERDRRQGARSEIARGLSASMIAPSTPLNRSISSERSFAGVTISLSRAKALAKAAGGKLNDVVMAISSGVLRRHLASTRRPARALADRGGADFAARAGRFGGQQSGVRHGLLARERHRRPEGAAARDHRGDPRKPRR